MIISDLGWSLPARASRLDEGHGQNLSRESCRKLRILRKGRAGMQEMTGPNRIVRLVVAGSRAPSATLPRRQSAESARRSATTRRTIRMSPCVFSICARSCERVRRFGGDPLDHFSRSGARIQNHALTDVKLCEVARAEPGGCADRPKRLCRRHGACSRVRHAALPEALRFLHNRDALPCFRRRSSSCVSPSRP